MNNTKAGNKTEKKTAKIFRNKGYWAYNCPKSNTGSQPCDIIAIKGGNDTRVWFVDGKHVRDKNISFPLSRIEPNQWASMKYICDFAHINSKNVGFTIEFERLDNIYWLPYQTALEAAKSDRKSINVSELKIFDEVLDEHDNKR